MNTQISDHHRGWEVSGTRPISEAEKRLLEGIDLIPVCHVNHPTERAYCDRMGKHEGPHQAINIVGKVVLEW